MEIGLIDEISGRMLIEGRGTPIEGGVFRRANNPGIVADGSKLEHIDWYKKDLPLVLDTQKNLLGIAVAIAKERMPINETLYQRLLNDPNKGDRYSLNAFISKKDEMGREIGGGSPDTQALLIALLIEKRLKKDGDSNKKVFIAKDPVDGHAIVRYEGKSGSYAFDPTKGEQKFIKLEETGSSNG